MTSAFVNAQEGSDGTGTPTTTGGDLTAGQALYTERCARCHADDGSADTRMGQRFDTQPFTAEKFATLGADGVRASIIEGRENMRPETDLSAEQLDALVAYTMTLVP
jgi:mono/diheme cytochrome c family protein